MQDKGWFKYHRQIENWAWIDEPDTFWFFMRLISMANFEEKKWQRLTIPVGSFVSSQAKLQAKFKTSREWVRNHLDRLKATNEVTSQSTNKYTIYTIVNYNKYQSKEEEETSKTTSKATSKEYSKEYSNDPTTKEVKNIKKERIGAPENFDPDCEQIHWAKELGIQNPVLETSKFLDFHKSKGTKFKDWAAAWRNWMRKSVEYAKQNQPEILNPEDNPLFIKRKTS